MRIVIEGSSEYSPFAYEGSDEQAEELDKALDVLAVAQIMLTLDFVSGCLSS
jgi:hypothetical protein